MTAGNQERPEVIAVVFADAPEAHAARRRVRTLMHTHALCVEDMAVASRGPDGAVSVRARRSFWLAGMVGGLAWGIVLGGLLFQPLLGVIAGTLCGVFVGALSASGLDPAWLRHAAASLRPGEAALVMAVPHAQDKDALALVAGDTGRVVWQGEKASWGPAGENSIAETI